MSINRHDDTRAREVKRAAKKKAERARLAAETTQGIAAVCKVERTQDGNMLKTENTNSSDGFSDTQIDGFSDTQFVRM
jgi:hypothetical protein